MSDFYSAIIFLSVFIMIIMDMLVSGNDLMEHDKKQTVYTISVLVIACMVSEWFGVWMNGADPSLRTLHILVKTIELSTAPIITVLCSDLMTPLKHKKLIYTLIGVHAGLEVLSAFFGFIFSVDAQNVYHHETFYWVYVLAYASGVLLFIGQLLSESSHHYGLYRALVIILPVFFFCGLFLQYGAGVHIMWACSAVDVLMVYILYSELTQKIDTLTRLLNRRSYEAVSPRCAGTQSSTISTWTSSSPSTTPLAMAWATRCLPRSAARSTPCSPRSATATASAATNSASSRKFPTRRRKSIFRNSCAS